MQIFAFLLLFFSRAGRKVLMVLGIIALVLLAMILGWGLFLRQEQQALTPPPLAVTASNQRTCTLVKAIHGDQISALCKGQDFPVTLRILGVITPHIGTNTPGQHSECGAAASKSLTESQLHDKPFKIATDPNAQQHDQNGNLLVHIWSPQDGALLSQRLIEKGYGIADPTITDSALKQKLSAKQAAAKQKNMGNWMACRNQKN